MVKQLSVDRENKADLVINKIFITVFPLRKLV